MKVTPQVLLSSILYANSAIGSQSEMSRCVELNFKAANLQSGDPCSLLNTVINGGDILAGDTDDMTDIDATCGFHLDVENGRRTCVEEVVDVVSGMTDEGCEVTGG